MGRKRTNKVGFDFTPIPKCMLQSESWVKLPYSARALYVSIELFSKGREKRFSLSSRQASELLGSDKNTAAKALQALLDAGYLRLLKRATFSTARGNTASEYSLGRLFGWDFVGKISVCKIHLIGMKNSDRPSVKSGTKPPPPEGGGFDSRLKSPEGRTG